MKLRKRILKKITAGLSGIVLMTIIGGCDITFDKLKMDPSGTYECKPEKGNQGKTYKFDSTDNRTKVTIGTNPNIEFYDQNSEKIVRLYDKSNLKYNCECIQAQK